MDIFIYTCIFMCGYMYMHIGMSRTPARQCKAHIYFIYIYIYYVYIYNVYIYNICTYVYIYL